MSIEFLGGFLPIPPKTIKPVGDKRVVLPVSRNCMQLWLDSFNEWVSLWNEREDSGELNPSWPEASYIEPPHQYSAESHRAFIIKNAERNLHLFFRVRGYEGWGAGQSFMRRPLFMQHIVWACWAVSPYPLNIGSWKQAEQGKRLLIDLATTEIQEGFQEPKPTRR